MTILHRRGAVLLLALLLTGCVGPAPEPPPTVPASSPMGGATTPTAQTLPTDPIPPMSYYTLVEPKPPLSEYGQYVTTRQQTLEEYTAMVERHDLIQAAIAECMTQRGFWFTPTAFYYGPPSEENQSTLTLLDFVTVPYLDPDRTVVERNGYGVQPPPSEALTQNQDPNLDYRESLSPAEAEAYDAALHFDPQTQSNANSCTALSVNAYPEQPFDDSVLTYQ